MVRSRFGEGLKEGLKTVAAFTGIIAAIALSSNYAADHPDQWQACKSANLSGCLGMGESATSTQLVPPAPDKPQISASKPEVKVDPYGVMLGFDVVPGTDAGYLQAIAVTLKQNQVPATFFIDRAALNNQQIKDVVKKTIASDPLFQIGQQNGTRLYGNKPYFACDPNWTYPDQSPGAKPGTIVKNGPFLTGFQFITETNKVLDDVSANIGALEALVGRSKTADLLRPTGGCLNRDAQAFLADLGVAVVDNRYGLTPEHPAESWPYAGKIDDGEILKNTLARKLKENFGYTGYSLLNPLDSRRIIILPANQKGVSPALPDMIEMILAKGLNFGKIEPLIWQT